MKKLKISTPFKESIIERAKKMVLDNKDEENFVDENGKPFQGVIIFINKKPSSTLFTFDFPEDFEEGFEKKIYVGNN